MRTILHLISTNSNERESALALRLLLLVAQCGRTAKESICEHNGISCVVDCVLSEPPADARRLKERTGSFLRNKMAEQQVRASMRRARLPAASRRRARPRRRAAAALQLAHRTGGRETWSRRAPMRWPPAEPSERGNHVYPSNSVRFSWIQFSESGARLLRPSRGCARSQLVLGAGAIHSAARLKVRRGRRERPGVGRGGEVFCITTA